MHLKKINIYRFRNYTEEEISFSEHTNMITGNNGQGKTNLLEAIYFSCLGHSPRTRRDSELIGWGTEDFILRIEGLTQSGEEQIQSVQINSNGSKDIRVGNKSSKKLSDLMGQFCVVYFSPTDIEIITGSPGNRRRFIDVLLCQYSTDYIHHLRQYQRIVKQKNALLKDFSNYSLSILETLNEQLINLGSEIIHARIQFLEEFSPMASEIYSSSKGKDDLTLSYETFFTENVKNVEEIGQIFAQKLAQNRDSEMAIKSCLIGPHRDNLLVLLSGRKAADYGSQGQKRLVALSLKLASASILERQFHEPPILLLDDVFAELDEDRRIEVSQMMAKKGQVFLATPRQEDIPLEFDQDFKIEQGKVIRE